MKKNLLLVALLLNVALAFGQKAIRDKHITNQQERMVFKQWSKKKFTPTSGFLGLNPEYWLTWGLHPDYPKKDLRPLGPSGPQTQRMALVLALRQTTEAYKLETDTLQSTAVSESLNYSGLLSSSDPIWLLYYRFEFDPLLNRNDGALLDGADAPVRDYLTSGGLLSWYREELQALTERLDAARSIVVDRGSRMLAYHRLLSDYRKLQSLWEAKKQRAKLFLSLTESAGKAKASQRPVIIPAGMADRQLAEDILIKSHL